MNEKADAIRDEHARPERAHDGQFRLKQQREQGEEHSEQQIPDQRVQDVAQFAPWELLKKRDDFQRMPRSPSRPCADVRVRSFWFGLSIHDRILQRFTFPGPRGLCDSAILRGGIQPEKARCDELLESGAERRRGRPGDPTEIPTRIRPWTVAQTQPWSTGSTRCSRRLNAAGAVKMAAG